MLAYLTSKRVIPAPVMLFLSLFTTRRYASAVHAVAVCPSVCRSVRPSEAGIVSKPLDESRWFWARRLPFICFTLCCKEIRVSPKIRVLPHWNFVTNSLLRKFCHAQIDRVVNTTRRQSSLLMTPIRQSTSHDFGQL